MGAREKSKGRETLRCEADFGVPARSVSREIRTSRLEVPTAGNAIEYSTRKQKGVAEAEGIALTKIADDKMKIMRSDVRAAEEREEREDRGERGGGM